jgi:uncharacterized alpha-E superfamily protein
MILARHAESLFWVGRYLERSETTARWLEVASRASMHLLPEDAAVEWSHLVEALGLGKLLDDDGKDRSDVVDFLLTSNSPGSVRASLEAVRENLRVARDRVPVELWEAANRLHLQLGALAVRSSFDQPHEIFRTVREGCQAISGVLSEAMPRDEGHAYITIGRMLERSSLTLRLLTVANQPTTAEAETIFDADRVLRSSSALQAFRRRHAHARDAITVTSFLLVTPDLPRSVLSCLRYLEGRLASLDQGARVMESSQVVAGRIRSGLEYGDVRSALEDDPVRYLRELRRAVDDLAVTLGTSTFRPLGEPNMHAQFVRPGRSLR